MNSTKQLDFICTVSTISNSHAANATAKQSQEILRKYWKYPSLTQKSSKIYQEPKKVKTNLKLMKSPYHATKDCFTTSLVHLHMQHKSQVYPNKTSSLTFASFLILCRTIDTWQITNFGAILFIPSTSSNMRRNQSSWPFFLQILEPRIIKMLCTIYPKKMLYTVPLAPKQTNSKCLPQISF